jgi:hypothetical protein
VSEQEEPTVELEHIVTRFPDHRTLGKALQGGVNATMAQFRAARGDVVAEEDVYEAVRWAQGIAESFHEYGRAFAGAAALVGQYAEEELTEAVGEQDGVPLKSLTVPDVDGTDIRLSKETTNAHHIERDAVLQALAVSFVQEHEAAGMLAEILSDLYARVEMVPEDQEDAVYRRAEEHLATLVLLAFDRLTSLGSFSLQVSKVEAFRKELARRDTLLASTVAGAMSRTVKYTGVKMSRVTPTKKTKETTT